MHTEVAVMCLEVAGGVLEETGAVVPADVACIGSGNSLAEGGGERRKEGIWRGGEEEGGGGGGKKRGRGYVWGEGRGEKREGRREEGDGERGEEERKGIGTGRWDRDGERGEWERGREEGRKGMGRRRGGSH